MPSLYVVLFLFSNVYGLLGKNIVQPNALVRAQVGDTVTLPCFITARGEPYVSWLKHPLGLKPQLVVIVTQYQSKPTFLNEFGNSQRFSVNGFNLTVSQVELSDSATYYCAITSFSDISFGDGTTLMVMGSKSNSSADICGEVLFGNGAKLDFEAVPLYCLVGALALSVILNIVLALKRRKGSDDGKGAASISEVPREDVTHKQCQDEAMNYAALTFSTKKPKVKRNKREVEKETVYSDMRFRDRE